MLLQILDDGRLTDGQGRVVDFKNAVVIMTSNIGSRHFAEDILDAETVRKYVLDDLRAQFRPEFLNRVDEVIVFHRLDMDEIKQIVGIQLDRVQKRLADQHIRLILTPEAKQLIASEGYDPIYGARPLKRVIQKQILDALSLEILGGRFKEGDTIKVSVDKKTSDRLSFERS